MERQILTRIETLPNKVRLTTTRANQGSIDDLKDNSKGCNKELQGDDNEKEKAERTSSVYDVFDSIRKRKNKSVQIKSIINDATHEDFQIFIRAGMSNQLEKLSKNNNLRVENMKFLVSFRLDSNSPTNERDTEKSAFVDMAIKERRIPINENGTTLEDASRKGSIDPSTISERDGSEVNVTERRILSRASTLPLIKDQKSNTSSSYNATLTLNALHLAIIAKQKASVQWIINNILDDKRSDGKYALALQKIVDDKVSLSNANIFSSRDQILHEMNLFHLSSLYFPEAMKIIFETLDARQISSAYVLKSVRDDKNVFKFTPLHIAAKKSSFKAARYLIDNGAVVDALDIKKQTALHFAVKNGNENLVSLLVTSNEGQPNQMSEDGLTPLHLAKTPAVTQLLLNDGADPYHKNKIHIDPFSHLLKHNGKSAEVVLDKYLTTNGHELDSSALLLVYDFRCFDDGNEFARHTTMHRYNPTLLLHPLCEAMITLKWSLLSNAYKTYVMLKLIFVASLTFLVIMQSSYLKQSCGLSLNETGTDVKNVPLSDFKSLPYLYVLSTISLAILFGLEISQLFMVRTKDYYMDAKNWTDITMMLLTVVYFSSNYNFFLFTSPNQYSREEIGAVCIFLAWMYLVMAFRHTPRVGIYLHMVKNVSTTLFFFLLMYAPTLIAFSLCFYVLMPCEKDYLTFENPWKSGLKIIAMLIGEFDYEGNFLSLESPNIILIQIMSVLFLFFGTIVIMNLLVGLAVNEIDQLKTEALQMSLQEKVSCIIPFQKLHLDYFSCLVGRFNVFASLKKKSNQKNNQMFTKYSKLCIQPAGINDIERETYQFCGYRLPVKRSGHPVYFFDDVTMNRGKPTGFYFSTELARRTMEKLKFKEDFMEKLQQQVASLDFEE